MGEMAGGMLDSGGARDELKTQFMTREGTYHLMTLAEYSRPNRVGYANQAANCNAPVKVCIRSFICRKLYSNSPKIIELCHLVIPCLKSTL